jgi:hypothetical protein
VYIIKKKNKNSPVINSSNHLIQISFRLIRLSGTSGTSGTGCGSHLYRHHRKFTRLHFKYTMASKFALTGGVIDEAGIFSGMFP